MSKLLVAAVTLLGLSTGCASQGGEAGASPKPVLTPGYGVTTLPSPGDEPQTIDAAKAAMTRGLEAFAAGDWGGTWDTYTAQGKAAISRADYVRLLMTCKPIMGLPFTIKAARMERPGVARINVERGSYLGSYEAKYESGKWKISPTPESLADFALGVDHLIKKNKAEGAC